jgi:RNA polymerase sigma-70 factor, ECF subfamily
MTSEVSVQVVDGQGVGDPLLPASEVRREVMAQHRRLFTYAKMLVGDESAAEDLVQDTLERALRASHRFRSGTNAGAWLTRIMKNLFTDRYRHRVAIREINLENATGALVAEPAREPTYLDVLTNGDVLSALADMGARLRETFVLRHVDGLSYEEIAARFGVPMSTIGTRLRRARLRLRRIIENRLAEAGGPLVISSTRAQDASGRHADPAASAGVAVCRAGRRRVAADRAPRPREDLLQWRSPGPPGRSVRGAVHRHSGPPEGDQHRPRGR